MREPGLALNGAARGLFLHKQLPESAARSVSPSFCSRFGLLRYGLGAVGYSLLIVCVAVQWDMILESLLKGEALHFGYESLMILGFWMLLLVFQMVF